MLLLQVCRPPRKCNTVPQYPLHLATQGNGITLIHLFSTAFQKPANIQDAIFGSVDDVIEALQGLGDGQEILFMSCAEIDEGLQIGFDTMSQIEHVLTSAGVFLISEINLAKDKDDATVEATVEMTAVEAGSGMIGVAANEF
jgi:hypothetical protein